MECSICQKILIGKFYQNTEDHSILCGRCIYLPVCNVCMKPIPFNAKTIEIALNKHICQACVSKTVLNQEDLREPLEKSIRAIFELYKIKIAKLKIIKLISYPKMLRAGRSISGSPFRIAGIANNENEIMIRKGETKVSVLATVTHELAHLYQMQTWGLTKFKSMQPYLVEGFCEWLSIRVLEFYNEMAEAKKIADNPDNVYGLGARCYLKAEKEGRLENILGGVFEN